MTRFSAFLLAVPALCLAQGYNYGSSSTGTKTTKMAASSPTAASSSGSIHSIAVGEGGLKYTPNSITAKVGDQVEFHFDSAGHSVVEGAFAKPCQPEDADAFFSGFPKTGGLPFTITVNSTDPIWFYCAATEHCQLGMVGVINPPSGQTVDDFAAAAKKTSTSSAPAHAQGGVFANAKPASGSTSGSSSASSSASAKQTASPGAAPGQLLMQSLGMSLPLGILGYLLL